MRILYCDCFSGISGDMFLGALLDAGLPVEHLAGQLRLLDLPEFQAVSARKVRKGAIAATLLELSFESPGHDHHDHHDHHHHHRGLADIRNLIERSELSAEVKRTATRIFEKLAEAEARVHGTSIEEVHFHEVGAVDSILDIVGAAVGLAYFGIEAVYCSALPVGSGTVMTQHGLLPLPAPATLELIRIANVPVTPSKATVELVTPTGAAILATLAEFRLPEMRIQQVGSGAGRRDLEWPNILRVMIGEGQPPVPASQHVEIETNIDDMNPQVFGHVMGKLFQAGALDVYYTPIFMKKNRPATRLSVIANRADEQVLCDLLLRETSTLGVRVQSIRRHEAQRELRQLETSYGKVAVKLKLDGDVVVQAVPEFDDCARLADQNGVALIQLMKEIEALVYQQYPPGTSAAQ